MKIQIRYETAYAYEETVSFSPHLFRLFPRSDRFVRIARQSFETNAGAWIKYRRDLFDNEIIHCTYPESASELRTLVEMELLITEKNAFDFLLDSNAANCPFEYKASQKAALSPYLAAGSEGAGFELPFWRRPETPAPTVSVLVELNRAIYENIRYERRDEGEPFPPGETLNVRAGACRDFMVLMAAALRSLGVAARLVSGYLCEFHTEQKRAEGALHAWTEAYLPGAGWIGFDPTNGTMCNHNQIATAVGLTPADITPVLGTYYHGEKPVPSKMTANLELTPCDG